MPNPQPSHVCKRLETVIKIQPCAPGIITKHHLKALRDESQALLGILPHPFFVRGTNIQDFFAKRLWLKVNGAMS